MESMMKTAALLLFLLLLLPCCCNAQRVYRIGPHHGSYNGATRILIEGAGFAQENQFQLNPKDDNFGNKVDFVSDTLTVPCDVERDSTHGNRITCVTRPMPRGHYMIRVTVDGVPIPDSNLCSGANRVHHCGFYTIWNRTPTIISLSPVSGLPGTLVTARGLIFTSVYGSNIQKSPNGLNARFLRVTMGGMPCELLKPDSDELYNLRLDHDSSYWGYMSCKMTGTYVGHHNLSYIIDNDFGRSLAKHELYKVSGLQKLSMFQTFAEVTGVSPSTGSVMGGTVLTVHGRFFDQTDRPARVLVGGLPCEVLSVSDDRITCRTAKHHTNSTARYYPGGRGLLVEVWNKTKPRDLTEIKGYSSNATGYWTEWVGSLRHVFERSLDYFSSRVRGFFVPPATANYTIYLHCDDRCELYLSNSSSPEDMVKIAFQPRYVSDHTKLDSQKSEVLTLEEGKPYYIEILLQEFAQVASINIALFQEESSFTEAQTEDAVNEVQLIIADYPVFDEEQVVTFDSWPSDTTTVKEVQRVTVSSSCASHLCGSIFFSLGYGAAVTGPIPVSASANVVEASLNELWTMVARWRRSVNTSPVELR